MSSHYSIRNHINQVEELKEEFEDKILELEGKNFLSEDEKNYLEGCRQQVKDLEKQFKQLREKEIEINDGYDPLDDNINSLIAFLHRR